MAGTFSNFVYGLNNARQQHRQDREDEWLRREREFQRQRQVEQDGRTQQEHDWKVEDRPEQARQLGLRGAILDQNWQAGDQTLQLNRHKIERLPIEAQQADELHGLNIQNTRQAMGVRASQEARANAQHRIRMELDQLGLDEERLAAEHRQFASAIASGARRFMMNGDTKELSQAWRTAMGSEGSGELVKTGANRYVLVDPDTGDEQEIGSRDDVFNVLSTFMQRPEAFLELRYQQQFGGGQTGKQPSAVQQSEYVRRNLPRQEGESDQQHALRAWMVSQQAKAKSPSAVYQEVLAARLHDGMKDNEVAEVDASARRIAELYAQHLQHGGQAPAEPRSGGSARIAQPQTQAEFDTLPSGTQFQAPDGSVRVKP